MSRHKATGGAVEQKRPLGITICAFLILTSAGPNFIKYAFSSEYPQDTRVLLSLLCIASLAIGFGLLRLMKWAWEVVVAFLIGSVIGGSVFLLRYNPESSVRYMFYLGLINCTVYIVYFTRPRIMSLFTGEGPDDEPDDPGDEGPGP
jgi:uncharacterized membrane protein YfcA